jgi:hypothetical protein
LHRFVSGRWETSILGPDTLSLELDHQENPEKKVQAIAVAGVDGASQLGPYSVLAIE